MVCYHHVTMAEHIDKKVTFEKCIVLLFFSLLVRYHIYCYISNIYNAPNSCLHVALRGHVQLHVVENKSMFIGIV